MYKLYGNLQGWRLLDQNENEDKIKNTLAGYFTRYDHIEYIIKKELIDRDEPYMSINTEEEFYQYMDSGKGYSLVRKNNNEK